MGDENRLANIDTLRGVAALLVVLQHSAESFVKIESVAINGTGLADAAYLLDFGRVGVICFFLISGFVVPFSFDETAPRPVRKFATRRLFRLYPAYWLSLFLACSLAFALGEGFSTGTILANTTMLQSFLGERHVQGLYWTLEIELIFYTLCALLFPRRLLTSPVALTGASLLCLCAYAFLQISNKFGPWGEFIRQELRYIPYVLSVMFAGTVLRLAYDETGNKKLLGYSALLCTACLSVPVLAMLLHAAGIQVTSHPVRTGVSHLLGFALFFLGLVFFRKTNRYLLWLGSISYSLYLLHPIALSILLQAVDAAPALSRYHLSIYIITVAAAGILLASLSYILVEKPCIRLGRRFSAATAMQART